ncbi:MAG TPA: pyrimidine 5'-nucleotidase [Burkholderiaceae bacterium]|nr:pyrimidine 5'-nucleotidase [Burkholderiaceae bacterium]
MNSPPPSRPPRPVWLFDLDNTLHDASHAIFDAIDGRMTDYVQHALGIERAEANRLRTLYWRRYGATLLGLVRHHGIDAEHFLRETHDFGVAGMLRAERGLAHLFARLPGRKVLVTNAPRGYAGLVLRGLALHRHVRGRYTIESMRVHGSFRPKPSRLMLSVLLAREGIRPSRAILVEDSLPNIRAARALGVRTVLITRHSRSGGIRHSRSAGMRIDSLHQLLRRVPRH